MSGAAAIQFPVALISSDQKTLFKVFSAHHFEELRLVGKAKYSLFEINDPTLPNRNYIADLLNKSIPGWSIISLQDYADKLDYCQSERNKI